MINAAAYAQDHADAYTDLSSVQAIRKLEDKNQALEEISQQFESMMLRMMMKSMRSANEVFSQGNFLSSKESETYRDMLDDQMSLSLVEGRGLGIAEVMMRQLQGRYGSENKAEQPVTAKDNNYLQRRQAANNPNVQASPQAESCKDDAIAFDGSVQQFVDQLYPMAERAAAVLGVSPEVLIAQSALETGWGRKVSGRQNGDSSFNFFNIKAGRQWSGASVTVPTLEIRDGVPVREQGVFRAYSSAQHSFDDYVDFVSNSSRYEKALQCSDGESYTRALAQAGYATDTAYADKVIRIMNSKDMEAAVARAAERLDPEG